MTNIFHSSDGSKISYKVVGKGTPIVFIHGWGVDFRLWFNRIEGIDGPWKNNYQRIYFDLPGMGKSIASPEITDSDDILKNVEELIDFTIGNSTYILAGESYGGYLARGLVARQSERICGLFLLCPLIIPGWRKGKVAGRVVLERDEDFMMSLSDDQRKEFEFLSVIQTREMWRNYKEDIHLEQMAENAGFLEHRLKGEFTERIRIDNIAYEKPTLILLGRQDSEVGFEQQYELYKHFSRATIQILDKAGHNLQIERPMLFGFSFLDLLERIETA